MKNRLIAVGVAVFCTACVLFSTLLYRGRVYMLAPTETITTSSGGTTMTIVICCVLPAEAVAKGYEYLGLYDDHHYVAIINKPQEWLELSFHTPPVLLFFAAVNRKRLIKHRLWLWLLALVMVAFFYDKWFEENHLMGAAPLWLDYLATLAYMIKITFYLVPLYYFLLSPMAEAMLKRLDEVATPA